VIDRFAKRSQTNLIIDSFEKQIIVIIFSIYTFKRFIKTCLALSFGKGNAPLKIPNISLRSVQTFVFLLPNTTLLRELTTVKTKCLVTGKLTLPVESNCLKLSISAV
jgi:hypothetical protein